MSLDPDKTKYTWNYYVDMARELEATGSDHRYKGYEMVY